MFNFSPIKGSDLITMWQPFKNNSQIHIDALFSMFKKHYNSDYRFNGEVHDFWECVYVIDGDIQVSGDERVYAITAGDIIFHKPMELHKFSIESEKGATLFIFSFSLDGKLKDYFKNSVFALNREQKRIISDLLYYIETKSAEYKTKNERQKFYSFFLPAEKSEIYLQRVVYYLYQLFLSLADNGRAAHSISTPETALFKEAIRFMQENVTQQLTVNDIAKHCGISQSGLKRTFSKFAGISVHKYFLSIKLNAAMNLLQAGHTVSEVTDALNFSSQSYFSAAFKREIGSSPSKFKN